MVTAANVFKLPPDARLPSDPAQLALDLLKRMFGRSEVEIGDSFRVLVEAGMPLEEISSVTGAYSLYYYITIIRRDFQTFPLNFFSWRLMRGLSKTRFFH